MTDVGQPLPSPNLNSHQTPSAPKWSDQWYGSANDAFQAAALELLPEFQHIRNLSDNDFRKQKDKTRQVFLNLMENCQKWQGYIKLGVGTGSGLMKMGSAFVPNKEVATLLDGASRAVELLGGAGETHFQTKSIEPTYNKDLFVQGYGNAKEAGGKMSELTKMVLDIVQRLNDLNSQAASKALSSA